MRRRQSAPHGSARLWISASALLISISVSCSFLCLGRDAMGYCLKISRAVISSGTGRSEYRYIWPSEYELSCILSFPADTSLNSDLGLGPFQNFRYLFSAKASGHSTPCISGMNNDMYLALASKSK